MSSRDDEVRRGNPSLAFLLVSFPQKMILLESKVLQLCSSGNLLCCLGFKLILSQDALM